MRTNFDRDPKGLNGIVRFEEDIVKTFLARNNLQAIIRGHECVSDGIEKYAGGLLITVFSAIDYCGTHGKGGAILIVKKNLEIQQKIIYPS